MERTPCWLKFVNKYELLFFQVDGAKSADAVFDDVKAIFTQLLTTQVHSLTHIYLPFFFPIDCSLLIKPWKNIGARPSILFLFHYVYRQAKVAMRAAGGAIRRFVQCSRMKQHTSSSK